MLPSSWQSTSKLTIYSSVLCASSGPFSWLDSLILFCLSLFFFLSSLSFDDWFLFMIFICNHFDFVTNLPRMIWQMTPPPPQEKPNDGHSSYQGLRSAKSSTLPSPGYSMWNPWKGGWTAEIPDGIHGMVDGIHGMGDGMGDGFHGMGDGFHTFGGWIPWNGGWIPWFFHMDSIPFPHGFHPFPHGFHWFSRWIPYGMSSWKHNSTLIHKFKPKYWVDWNMGKCLNLIT